MKTYILNQLKQPSTWRGIVLLISATGVAITPEVAEAIIAVGMGLAGAIGVLTSDS